MRKFNLFLFLALFANVLSLTANKFIRLQFQPDFPIDSIRIDNLDSISSFTFVGEESLNVYMEEPTGVENTVLESDKLKVFSSRDRNEVQLSFYQQIPGLTTCEVFAAQGKLVARFSRFLESSYHRFTFVPDSRGMFLVRVSSPASIRTAKFSSYGATSVASLFYDGFTDTAEVNSAPPSFKTPSNQNKPLVVRQDDLLRICCYSGSKSQVIYDYANGDKNYDLHFTDQYSRFQLHYVSSSGPAFVNLIFSVTDAANKGVDDLSNDDFVVKEDSADLLNAESFSYVRQLDQVPFQLKTVLLIDNSTGNRNDLETVKIAAKSFIQKIRPDQSFAVYEFSDMPLLRQYFTSDKELLHQAINGISPKNSSSDLYGSVSTALSIWTDHIEPDQLTQGQLIVVTNSVDTKGTSTPDNVLIARGSKKVYTIGLRKDLNPEVMSQLASPSCSFLLSNVGELDETFNQIQADIVRHSRSFYWLNFISPQRSGTHTLSVSTSVNANLSETGMAAGRFSAEGFQTVNPGLYVNVTNAKEYGIDTIFCFYKEGSYGFSSYRYAPYLHTGFLLLKPVSYRALQPPSYKWTVDNPRFFKLEDTTNSSIILKGIGGDTITTTLTVRDEANSYSKQLVVQMIPEHPLFKVSNPTDVTDQSVTLHATVLHEGRFPILDKGFIIRSGSFYAKINAGKGIGNMSAILTDLKHGTRYSVQAYATNSSFTTYAYISGFTTLPGLPELTTKSIVDITNNSATTGGLITHDGGLEITARGVCWSTSPGPTVNDYVTRDGAGAGNFTSSIAGLISGTKYYVRAYATNRAGTSYGNELSFYAIVAEGEVYNAITNRIWMDRNLGAARVATSGTDAAAYGDLYQWGRGADGHEKRTSSVSTTLSNSDTPGHGMFIIVSNLGDWQSTPNDNLWQGVNGKNNPCPDGFYVPTAAEWEAERASWSASNSAGAFESPLKLTLAGSRNDDKINDEGVAALYWTSTVEGKAARHLNISGGAAFVTYFNRRTGSSVRCIKEVE